MPGALLEDVKISMRLQLHFVGVGDGVVRIDVDRLLEASL